MLLKAEQLVSGGRALAHDRSGKRVLVAGALPGETVEAVVEKDHASYSLARVERVVSAHPERISPPCPYWGECGGCDFQYASPSYQRAVKEEVVTEALERVGGVDPASYRLEEQEPSPNSWEYRSRVRFFVSMQTKEAGFLRRRSNTLIPISHCPVLTPTLNDLLANSAALYEAARKELFANRIKGGL